MTAGTRPHRRVHNADRRPYVYPTIVVHEDTGRPHACRRDGRCSGCRVELLGVVGDDTRVRL